MNRRKDRRRARRRSQHRAKSAGPDPTTIGVALGLVAAGALAGAILLLGERAPHEAERETEIRTGAPAAGTAQEPEAPPSATAKTANALSAPAGAKEREAPLPVEAPLPEVGTGLRGPAFQLARVELLGLERIEAAEIVQRASLHAGMPLVDVDPQQVKDAVASHPRVSSCRAARLPPDALLVEVTERVPLAALHDGKKPTGEGVDTEGERVPLTEDETSALPQVEGDPDLALPLLRAAADSGLALERIVVRSPQDVAFEPSGWKLRIRTGTDPARAIQDWTRLVRTAQVRANETGEVDLRFRGRAVLRGGAGKAAESPE